MLFGDRHGRLVAPENPRCRSVVQGDPPNRECLRVHDCQRTGVGREDRPPGKGDGRAHPDPALRAGDLLLPVRDVDQARHGLVVQRDRRNPNVRPPNEAHRPGLPQVGVGDDQKASPNSDGVSRCETGPGCVQAQRPRDPSIRTKDLGSALRAVPGHDRIAREHPQPVQPTVLAGTLARSPRPPQEDALPVVPSQDSACPLPDDDVAVAEARGARDRAQQVFVRAVDRADPDHGFLHYGPSLAGAPHGNERRRDRDPGGVDLQRGGGALRRVASGQRDRKDAEWCRSHRTSLARDATRAPFD